MMANLPANLRGQCATAWEQAERFLLSVNRLFCDNTGESDHATLFFAEYDDRTRQLRYANCGHPPAFLLRRNDSLERLAPTSTVMGLFSNWNCTIEKRRLEAGDAPLLYTDGVTESLASAGEEFGEERLLEALREHRERSPDEMLTGITEQVKAFSPHEQADDITLIAAIRS